MPSIKSLTTALATLGVTVALGAAAAAPASARTSSGYSPSGNITCKATQYGDDWSLVCSVRDIRKTVKISASGRAFKTSYRSVAKRGRKMNYGGSYRLGQFQCSSDEVGVTCTTGARTGVFLSRESVRVYNN